MSNHATDARRWTGIEVRKVSMAMGRSMGDDFRPVETQDFPAVQEPPMSPLHLLQTLAHPPASSSTGEEIGRQIATGGKVISTIAGVALLTGLALPPVFAPILFEALALLAAGMTAKKVGNLIEEEARSSAKPEA